MLPESRRGPTEMSLIDKAPIDGCTESNEMDLESGSDDHNKAETTRLYPGETLAGTGFRLMGFERLCTNNWLGYTPHIDRILEVPLQDRLAQRTSLPSLDLTPQDVTRWKMAWRETTKLSRSERDHTIPLVERCKDWPAMQDMLEPPMALSFSATAIAYGGLHALAWYAHFNSPTEQLLWRISACVVMGGVPCLIILMIVVVETLPGGFFMKSCRYFVIGAFWPLLLAYVLARAYLVVECFINLAHLPAGVYDVPSWAAYFPHIS